MTRFEWSFNHSAERSIQGNKNPSDCVLTRIIKMWDEGKRRKAKWKESLKPVESGSRISVTITNRNDEKKGKTHLFNHQLCMTVKHTFLSHIKVIDINIKENEIHRTNQKVNSVGQSSITPKISQNIKLRHLYQMFTHTRQPHRDLV